MADSNPLIDFINRYRGRPVLFVREVMGAEPDPPQAELMNRIAGYTRRVSVRSGHGTGKGNPKSLEIPTPDGVRRWGDLRKGDRVFGSDGHPTTVTGIFDRGVIPAYRVTFDDGSATTVDGDHLWNIRGRQERRKGQSGYRTMSTAEIVRKGVKRSNGSAQARQWEIPVQGAAVFEPQQAMPFDPYWVGVWLGGGDRGQPYYYKPEPAIVDRLRQRGMTVTELTRRFRVEAPGWREYPVTACKSPDRYVPEEYRMASVEDRWQLLCGLLDTDGEAVHTGSVEYTTTSPQLAEDVIYLARSLGYKAGMRPTTKQGRYRDSDGNLIECRVAYRVGINMADNPFTHTAKAARFKPSEHRYQVRWIESIEPVGGEDVTCISVAAPDQLYLANDFIVTHNTTTLAWTMIYTLVIECVYGGVKVVCTAPSSSTLFDGLMSEAKSWINKLPADVNALFDVTSERIRLKSLPDECFISARTSSADSPEALAGIHADRVLIIVDEASGVPEAVFNAARGSMSTPNASTVLIGNPTRNSGYFFDTHHKLRDMWSLMHINSEESPRVDPDFLAEVLANSLGNRDHNEYRIRVRGEFPLDDGEAFIPRHLVNEAAETHFQPSRATPSVWGLDVARSGDDKTVIAIRHGASVIEVDAWTGRDLMETAGQVKTRWDQTPTIMRPEAILVDSIGLGAGVLDRLIELELPAIGINVSQSTGRVSRGFKQRDDLWCHAFDLLSSHAIQLPRHEPLTEELTAVRAMEYSSDGSVRIEPKKETKKRLGRSPDYADAVLLTLSHPATNLAPINTVTSTPQANNRGYRRKGALKRKLGAVV